MATWGRDHINRTYARALRYGSPPDARRGVLYRGAQPPVGTSDRARSAMRIIDFDGNEHPINIAPINEGSEAMRGDPTDRCQRLASWLLVLLILALVAIALHDVM